MIKVYNQNISSAYLGDRAIISIYVGGQLAWTMKSNIQSCFALGYWIDEYPWTDDLPWKD